MNRRFHRLHSSSSDTTTACTTIPSNYSPIQQASPVSSKRTRTLRRKRSDNKSRVRRLFRCYYPWYQYGSISRIATMILCITACGWLISLSLLRANIPNRLHHNQYYPSAPAANNFRILRHQDHKEQSHGRPQQQQQEQPETSTSSASLQQRLFKTHRRGVESVSFRIRFRSQRNPTPTSVVVSPLRSLHLFSRYHPPDHGGLIIRIPESLSQRGQRRIIYHAFDLDETKGVDTTTTTTNNDDYHDGYYAFDDDTARNPALTYDDDHHHQQQQQKCRRTNWHRLLLLNCNTLHEYDALDKFRQGTTQLVAQGSYRTVFLTTDPTEAAAESNALKVYRYDQPYDYTAYEFMRMDALVTERLTSSPLIMNIYANCGLSMLHEPAGHGNLEDIAVGDGDGRRSTPLNDADHLLPQNRLAPTLKLTWSLRMAQAVATLHGYAGGVMVHDDIQLPQFLVTADGELKLNDFNRAEVMLFDDHHSYCGYRNNPGHGDWRSPEEYADKPLNEQIDVWSLGNNMYTLLTGLFPFYETRNVEEIKKRVMNQETAFIDPRWKYKSYAEGVLANLIPKCWKFDPADRITVFELVQALETAVQDNRKEQQKVKLRRNKENPHLRLALQNYTAAGNTSLTVLSQ